MNIWYSFQNIYTDARILGKHFQTILATIRDILNAIGNILLARRTAKYPSFSIHLGMNRFLAARKI